MGQIDWAKARDLGGRQTSQRPTKPLTEREMEVHKQMTLESLATSAMATVIAAHPGDSEAAVVNFAFRVAELTIEKMEEQRAVISAKYNAP